MVQEVTFRVSELDGAVAADDDAGRVWREGDCRGQNSSGLCRTNDHLADGVDREIAGAGVDKLSSVGVGYLKESASVDRQIEGPIGRAEGALAEIGLGA